MALDFPTSPAPGTIFQGGGGAWLWDGTKWISAVAGVPPGNADYDTLVWLGSEWTVQRPRYVVSCYVPGKLTADQNLLFHRFAANATFPAEFGSYLLWVSTIGCSVAATADATFDIAKAPAGSAGSFANVGVAQLYAGALFGAFGTVGDAPVVFGDHDIMRIRAPSTPDATLSDVFLTLVGFQT